MDDNSKRIVEGLRYCGEIGMVGAENCEICPAFGLENGEVTCTDALMSQAADLIEKLSARAEAAEMDLTELANRMTVSMVCTYCAHREEDAPCADWDKCFAWRGVQEERTNDNESKL